MYIHMYVYTEYPERNTPKSRSENLATWWSDLMQTLICEGWGSPQTKGSPRSFRPRILTA